MLRLVGRQRLLRAIPDRLEDSTISPFFLVCDMRRRILQLQTIAGRLLRRSMTGRRMVRARRVLFLGWIKCERNKKFSTRIEFRLFAKDGRVAVAAVRARRKYEVVCEKQLVLYAVKAGARIVLTVVGGLAWGRIIECRCRSVGRNFGGSISIGISDWIVNGSRLGLRLLRGQ